MKQINKFLLSACFLMCSVAINAQDRYLEPIFDDIQVESNIEYATNISVLSGMPLPTDLFLDVYSPPASDTEDERPVVVLFHTGNFLPIGTNGTTAGTRGDSVIVEIATRLAQHGYVTVVPDYRKGWNPISSDINVRVSTLINAAYRGVQDARACVRFLRKSIEEENNPYGICSDRIAYWGVGTGGYISLAAATLDAYEDVVIPKFIDSNTLQPYVTLQANSDPDGLTETPLNQVNHPGYSSDVSLSINMGGALGDTSWLDASDVPFITVQVPVDPFAPYEEGVLIVPTTGDPIVEVQGSYVVAQKANAVGVNDIFVDANYNDPISMVANARNDGLNGLFPMPRPCGNFNPLDPTAVLCEGSPWDWWDSGFWSTQPHPSCPMGVPVNLCNFDVINRLNNPDQSGMKGRLYVDSIMAYVTPRAFDALELGASCTTSTEDILTNQQVGLSIAPNPAANFVMFNTSEAAPIQQLTVFNLAGQIVMMETVNNNRYRLDRDNLNSGMYIVKLQFEEGIVTSKLMFN